MARTTLTPITPKGPFPTSVAANDLDFVFTAADVANGNQFTITGREVLLVQNVNAGAQTVTLTDKACAHGTKDTISAYSFGAGEFGLFSYIGGMDRWRQSDGFAYLDASHADIKFAVIKLP